VCVCVCVRVCVSSEEEVKHNCVLVFTITRLKNFTF